ncbi:hypothetical protein BC834DRAFT_911165 [Gloeopeniophorella convolvens]|nr:hypothetical protein BC834DRAFT_911165 [Gloeopeniophorella convolvens]
MARPVSSALRTEAYGWWIQEAHDGALDIPSRQSNRSDSVRTGRSCRGSCSAPFRLCACTRTLHFLPVVLISRCPFSLHTRPDACGQVCGRPAMARLARRCEACARYEQPCGAGCKGAGLSHAIETRARLGIHLSRPHRRREWHWPSAYGGSGLLMGLGPPAPLCSTLVLVDPLHLCETLYALRAVLHTVCTEIAGFLRISEAPQRLDPVPCASDSPRLHRYTFGGVYSRPLDVLAQYRAHAIDTTTRIILDADE